MNGVLQKIAASSWISAAFLTVLVSGLYLSSLDNSFHYDDRHVIVENPHIRSLDRLPQFFLQPAYFSRDADKAMYRPLLLCSLALNYAWSGYQTYSYHLVNIGLRLSLPARWSVPFCGVWGGRRGLGLYRGADLCRPPAGQRTGKLYQQPGRAYGRSFGAGRFLVLPPLSQWAGP